MNEHLKIRANAAPWRRAIELYIVRRRRDELGRKLVVTGFTMEALPDNQAISDDQVLTMSNDDAQLLMDDLWHAGLRPTEGSGSAGSLLATEKHLKDWREIGKKLLDKVLNE